MLHEQLRICGVQCVSIIWSLLKTFNQTVPLDLLVLLLSALKKIAEWALMEGIPISGEGLVSMETIKDYVGNFTTYHNSDVASIAIQLERLLDQNFFIEE